MGAVFSGGGAVVSYDDGVQAAASGTTGTQRNEFTAAIKSVTSSTTVGAVFLYDTSADSDGGKWRSKCKGLSWFDEASSATRSARSEFPAMALIVADNVSDTETLTIYDLDDPAMPLWMQFTVTTQASPYHDFWRDGRDVTSIFALNGRLYFGTTEAGASQAGLKVVDFVDDRLSNHNIGTTTQWNGYFDANVANRNSTTKVFLGDTFTPIVNQTVNDVAATVLEGAEIGALGLPIPTVAVATGSGSAGGFSVIHPSGDVYSKTTTGTLISKVAWSDDSLMVSQTDYAVRFSNSELYASDSGTYPSSFTNGGTVSIIGHFDRASVPNLIGTAANDNDKGFVITGGNDMATGSSTGLTRVKWNEGNVEESAVAYITSSYNTGYQVGDIRGAWLANSLTADRSVKGNTLTNTDPSVDYTAGLGIGADITAIGPFSASKYLKIVDGDQGNDYDFNDTDDFSIMFWLKDSSTSTLQNLMARGNASQQAGDWLIHKDGSGRLYFYRHSGGDATDWRINADNATSGTATARYTADGVVAENQWVQVVAVRRSSKFNWYVNGELSGTPQSDTNTYNPSATLVIGTANGATTQPATAASLALLRISATAPTPQQIADIYSAEKVLFQAGAKCLLDENPVNDLAYDKTSGLLHVASETTDDGKTFRGLEAVGSLTSDGTFGLGANKPMDYLSASGGVVAGVGGETAGSDDTSGVGVNLPALDVRAELNEGESKLPDDGKLHFEGVTANTATPTVIGNIPLAESEVLDVKAKVVGVRYNSVDSSYRIVAEINQRLTRTIGGDAEGNTASYSLKELSATALAAGVDVVIENDTASDCARIKVTGESSVRMVWKASVEVQRISDKTYER